MSLAFGLDGRILIIGKRENKKERIASYWAKNFPNPCIIQKKLNIWCNVEGTDTVQPSHLEITSAHLCK